MTSENKKRYDTIIEKLKENNYKLTPQRLALVKILAESKAHPSVEDIYKEIKNQYPTMSLSTIYRNILTIKSLGEVQEIGFPDGKCRYDGKNPNPHPHVICICCNKIIDPEVDTLMDLTKEVEEKTGFDIKNYRLDFFGICKDCKEK